MRRTDWDAPPTKDSFLTGIGEHQSQIFLLAVEQTADSVIVTDRDALILYVNAAFEKLSGFSRAEVIGQHPSMFRSGHHSPSFISRVNRVLYGGRVFRGIFTSRAKNGELFWEEKTITPITNADGEITNFVSTGRDVSEIRKARELELRLHAAEEAERVMTDLLSTTSHELRTPLAAMMSYATAIRDYGEALGPQKVTEYLTNLEKRGKQLQHLIDDLLTMSRLEAGNMPVERQPAAIQDVISEALDDWRLRTSFHIESEMPQCPLYASIDINRIREVLQNLLDNAEKHSGPIGKVTIRARPLDESWIEVTVRDQGRGVEQQELEAIFQRFYRTKTESGTDLSGAGLGLSICKGIVEAHGGKIGAELPPEGGLAVSFTVPLVTCTNRY